LQEEVFRFFFLAFAEERKYLQTTPHASTHTKKIDICDGDVLLQSPGDDDEEEYIADDDSRRRRRKSEIC
jgi:hypothetical protein